MTLHHAKHKLFIDILSNIDFQLAYMKEVLTARHESTKDVMERIACLNTIKREVEDASEQLMESNVNIYNRRISITTIDNPITKSAVSSV